MHEMESAGRNAGSPAARIADGWTVHRMTRPSRFANANGIRTGADGRIYVAQVAGSRVSAIDVDSGEIETISAPGEGIVGPDDLAFDDEGNLYCTEITRNQVSMRTPSGAYKVVAGDVAVANPITFQQGRLIVGELDMNGRIMELDRNGGAPRVIASGLPMVNAFEIGPDGKLYFPAQGANEIWRVPVEGGEPEVVARDLGVPDSVKFHPDGSIISTQVYSGQVLRIDPRTGEKQVMAQMHPGLDNVAFIGNRTFVSHIDGSLTEILGDGKVKPVVDKGLQWPLGLAVGANGHILIADGGFTFLLQPGEEPQQAGNMFTPGFPGWVRDCVTAGADEWVVSTANGDIARWNPAAETSEMLAQGYDRLMGVDVAPDGSAVFAELPTGRVLSAKDGNVEELASGLDRPYGVAVGPDGTVFVAEKGAGRVVKLSGGRTETVIDGLGGPEGIVAHEGRLYISDPGSRSVVTCDLSGGGRETVGEGLPIGSPEGAPNLGGVGSMCGPMWTYAGIAVAPDGTVYVSAELEGSVIALRRS